jgi:hypothetical protein
LAAPVRISTGESLFFCDLLLFYLILEVV